MNKKHWTIAYSFYYCELSTSSQVVYGTKQEAKDYLLKELKAQPEWLQNQVDTDFNSKSRTRVYIDALDVKIL